jgi:chemotaxis signal transduction protein
VRPQRTAPRKGAREDVILFTVGEFRFAIAANAVSEIRSMDGLRHFSAGSGYNRMPKVEFTLERNRATYFVVNAARHFHLGPSKPSRVLILRQGPAAVLVDSTDRMTEISVLHALPQAFSGEERNWYRGLAVVNGDVVPVVNQAAFLSKGEALALKDVLEQSKAIAATI